MRYLRQVDGTKLRSTVELEREGTRLVFYDDLTGFELVLKVRSASSIWTPSSAA